MSKPNFEIGDIVTLKSHPLAFQPDGAIDAYVNQIPPFMCVKEIHIEKKKLLYSNESEQKQIADNVKYLCVYFNQHRMIFEERFVYQKVLMSFKDIIFHNKKDVTDENHTKLIDETLKYNLASYEFGKRVFFKTYKLEKRKQFKMAGMDINNTRKTIMTHTSPAFIINGYKPNELKSIYNPKTGELQRECCDELYKVIWYNAYQEKFSEEYLPKEFLTDDKLIYSSVKISTRVKRS